MFRVLAQLAEHYHDPPKMRYCAVICKALRKRDGGRVAVASVLNCLKELRKKQLAEPQLKIHHGDLLMIPYQLTSKGINEFYERATEMKEVIGWVETAIEAGEEGLKRK